MGHVIIASYYCSHSPSSSSHMFSIYFIKTRKTKYENNNNDNNERQRRNITVFICRCRRRRTNKQNERTSPTGSPPKKVERVGRCHIENHCFTGFFLWWATRTTQRATAARFLWLIAIATRHYDLGMFFVCHRCSQFPFGSAMRCSLRGCHRQNIAVERRPFHL